MRGPAQPLLRPGDEPERRAALGRWLVAVTVVSALIFLAGLGLLLFGPRTDAGPAAAAAAVEDAGARADAAPRAADPTPPEGMILVRRADGAPWLFVAKQPVSQGEYAAAHPPPTGQPAPRPLTRRQAAQPIVGVSYADAEAHARGGGMRLLRPDEWAAATRTEGFEPPGKGLWEWVNDGTQGAQALRAVRAAPDKADRLRPAGHANVVFRLARDP